MPKVSTNISLDQELKSASVLLFSKFGLDLSTAITLFLQQSVREQRIPFEIRMEVPNNDTLEALAEFNKMKNDKESYKRYSSFKEIMEELNDAEDSDVK